MMSDSSSGECIQRTYTAEQVAQILGISLRKAYGLCETTTQFKVMRLGKRCRGRLISTICKRIGFATRFKRQLPNTSVSALWRGR